MSAAIPVPAARQEKDARAEFWPAALVAAAVFLVHLVLNHRYGFHRDELAMVDYAARLDWGYVEFPPLTPALVRLSQEMFGDTLRSIRLFAALAHGLAVLLAALVAREMGGRRTAQVVAALATAIGPYALIMGSVASYATLDFLWWVAVCWAVSRLCAGRDRRNWLLVGLFFGLGLQTKYTILVLAAALAVAIVLTPLRRDLRSPWLWAGAALALLMAAPNVWWQWQHDWIAIDFTQGIHARDVAWGRTEGFLLGQITAGANPVVLPLWGAGLVWFWTRRGRAFLALGLMYLGSLLLFWLLEGRDYYLSGMYPALLAGGAVGLEQVTEGLRARRAIHATVITLLVVAAAGSAIVALPIAPVNSWGWRLSAEVHDVFREQMLWPELVAATAEAWEGLTPDEQAVTGIFTANYGEAGAINRLGGAYGLPRATSSVNTYWLWGPPEPPPTAFIMLGYQRAWLPPVFESCRLAARLENPLRIVNEEAAVPTIWYCSGLETPLDELWPEARDFG